LSISIECVGDCIDQHLEHMLAQEITKPALDYLSKDFSFAQLNDPENKVIVDKYVQFVFDYYFEILDRVDKKINPRKFL